jgi:hypothetical protein
VQHIVLGCFSAFLIITGLMLGIREIRTPIRLTGVVSRMRRRLLGATLLCVLGGLIGQGPLPQAPIPKEMLMQSALYWAGVLGLTCVLVGLAVWDTLDGVRALNHHLESVESVELKKIQQALNKK